MGASMNCKQLCCSSRGGGGKGPGSGTGVDEGETMAAPACLVQLTQAEAVALGKGQSVEAIADHGYYKKNNMRIQAQQQEYIVEQTDVNGKVIIQADLFIVWEQPGKETIHDN